MSLTFRTIEEAKIYAKGDTEGEWRKVEETKHVSQSIMLGIEPDEEEKKEMDQQETWEYTFKDTETGNGEHKVEFTFAPFRDGWCAWCILTNGMCLRM